MCRVFFKQLLITTGVVMIMFISTSSMAELMVPVGSVNTPPKPTLENRLGGTIATVDQKGLTINGVYYPFNRYRVKIHGMNGKVTRKSMLKPGMLVSVEVIKQNQTVKISEIWVIKDE